MAKQINTVINKPELATLCADAISELERAVCNFPTWPSELLYSSTEEYEQRLTITRALNDHGRETGVTIFEEEFLEFLVIASKGNRKWARIELVQAMAMLLRIYSHLNDYVPLRAEQEPRDKPVAVACPAGTPDVQTGHEEPPRLGCAKGYPVSHRGTESTEVKS